MKRLLFSAFILFSSVPGFTGTDEDTALYNRGMESFNRSLYVEALADFMELASRSPASPLAEKSRALIWEIGDRIRRMEERWDTPGKDRRTVGDESSAREFRKMEALAALDRLVGRAGKDAEYLLRNLGGGALAAESGQSVDALQLEARLYELRGKLRAVGWTPENLLEAEGYAALEAGDLGRCVEAWGAVLSGGAGDGLLENFSRRASARWEATREDALFQQALAAGKSSAQAGDDATARAALARALILKPGDAEAGRLLNEAETRAKGANPSEAFRVKLAEATALSEKGEYLKAIPLLVEALELKPGQTEALALLSSIKERLPQRPPANAASKPRKSPASPQKAFDRNAAEEAYTLGMMHYVRGDAAKAVPFFEKARDLDPSFEEAAQALDSVRRERRAP